LICQLVTKQKMKWMEKLPKKFCVNTKGLKPEERKEFATELNKFVSDKKDEFEERRNSEDDM